MSQPEYTPEQRLDNVNNHFRHQAAAVLNDEAALKLLATLHQESNIDIPGFNGAELAVPLAKLAAANFVEIGAAAIYITQAGRRFIMSING